MKDKKAPGRNGARPSKTGFILSFDESVPASEVVSQGKTQGLELSEKYVWAIRSSARRKGGKSAPRGQRAKATSVSKAPPQRVRAAAPGAGGSVERQFLALILDIGLRRAEELMASVRHRLSSLGS